MKTYNTYQEAKIANPDSGIYKWVGKFTTNSHSVVGYPLQPCNPADYCMTVKEFLKLDYQFVVGDHIENSAGKPFTIKCKYSASTWNAAPEAGDENRYVLKAKALEEKEESVEWKNGETAYVKDCTYDEIRFVGLAANSHIAVCECITSERKVVLDKFWLSDLIKDKPETPEQKRKREELESAYDLYCHCALSGSASFDAFKSDSNVRNFWAGIVRKTEYRKQ